MNLKETLKRVEEKKAELDARRPLPEAVAAQLKTQFDVEWTYHSSGLAGSTLTLHETEVILQQGLTIGGKTLEEHLEALNHKKAIDLVETLARETEPLNENYLLQIHAVLFNRIDDSEAGHYRRGAARIRGAEYLPPEASAVPGLMNDFFPWLDRTAQRLSTVERAATAHYRFMDIHPFTDANSRMAGLLMNLILLRAGYPPAIIRREDRPAYHTTLDQACAGQTKPFMLLIAEAVERSLDVFLAA
jgi:Fic family protein